MSSRGFMAGNVDHPASHRKPKRYSNTPLVNDQIPTS
jgi:hypothetical protein